MQLVGLGASLKTLMSKTRYTSRQAFTIFVALLQLAVLPATYTLHVGCEHAGDHDHHEDGLISSIVSCFSGHCCSCSHHSNDDDPENDPPSGEEPHDSDSCAVCQAAFATSTAEFFAPRLTAIGAVCLIADPEALVPASGPQYRSRSRGPPVYCRAICAI